MLSSQIKEISKAAILDRKIEETAAGLPASCARILRIMSEDDVSTIINYISTIRVEVNLSDHYRKDLIEVISRFTRYNDNKPFKDLVEPMSFHS